MIFTYSIAAPPGDPLAGAHHTVILRRDRGFSMLDDEPAPTRNRWGPGTSSSKEGDYATVNSPSTYW
ncbi:hypothetical protein ACEE18_10450 [Corynebacterium freneyi]